jgi:hypothetical protein
LEARTRQAVRIVARHKFDRKKERMKTSMLRNGQTARSGADAFGKNGRPTAQIASLSESCEITACTITRYKTALAEAAPTTKRLPGRPGTAVYFLAYAKHAFTKFPATPRLGLIGA